MGRMTLDEAINHAEEVAKKQESNAKSYPRPDKNVKGSGRKYNACLKCAEEHRQLAEWLKELKKLREQTRWIPVSERLPKCCGMYLVTRKIYECPDTEPIIMTDESWFDGTNTWHNDNRINHDRKYLTDVIAWMSLPDPYDPQESEG